MRVLMLLLCWLSLSGSAVAENCFHFDGANDRVTFTATNLTGDFTLSFWITAEQPDDFITGYVLADAAGDNYLKYHIGEENTGSTFSLKIDGTIMIAEGVFSVSTVTKDVWYHYIVVRNGTVITIYRAIAGSPLSSEISIDTGVSPAYQVSQLGNSSNAHDGKIFDDRFYDSALSSDDRTTVHSFGIVSATIKRWYRLDESSGNAIDRGADGADGTPVDVTAGTFYATGAPHRFGNMAIALHNYRRRRR